MEIKPEVVTAAMKVLSENFDLGGSADVHQFIWKGQTETERQNGISRLRRADELAEAKVKIIIADAIRAALEVMNKDTKHDR